ncbi:MAG: hypothetical protein JRI25_22535 [Deltaproteobacteria bacterium]|nr:hypothetical protein [Deltaproteobacteria bacterium]
MAPEPVPLAPVAARVSGTVCDSSQHETSELASDLTFDFGCAIDFLKAAGCDFELDPNVDGRPISSSTIEDLQNDPVNCKSGSSCSGCTDADTIDTIDDCRTLAATSYFTEGAWKDLAAQCPGSAPAATACQGGTWGSGDSAVTLTAEEECDVIEIANWATRGQLTDVTIHSGPVTPSAGLLALAASNLAPRGAYVRGYTTIDQILGRPEVGQAALRDLKAFIPKWKESGRMGDPTVSAEQRLLLFVNDSSVGLEELGAIRYVPSTAEQAIVDGRPFGTYTELIAAIGATTWNDPQGSMYAYAQEWYVMQTDSGGHAPVGCAIEGVEFTAEEMTCALQLFAGMSCDVCTDLLDSRVCEDAINDPLSCQAGSACTGCDDGDSRANGVDCEEIAAYSYFGPVAAETLLAHVQAYPCEGGAACVPACDGRTCGDDGCGGSCGTCSANETCGTDGLCAGGGCTIEDVVFDQSAIDCALAFFEGMECTTCVDLFDSRICEDAINDAGMCQVGSTCSGCDDDDTRDDGVTCEEIERYSYFGTTAAHKLLTYVRTDYSCGAPAYIYEGVPLTGEEVAAIIELANLGTRSDLDDGAALDSRAVDGIIAARPIQAMPDFAGIPYLGKTAMEKMRDHAMTWSPAGTTITNLTIAELADEAVNNGTASPYNDEMARVSRAIITSVPRTTGGDGLLFYVADPSAGNLEQLKVYVAASAAQTAKFTKYGNYFELLLDDPSVHSIALNKSGLDYDDYDDIEAAWHSTAANPEGVARVPSTFGYTFMVPLPLLLDHPMWGGSPPGPPRDSGNEQDHAWNAAAGDALDAWKAGN